MAAMWRTAGRYYPSDWVGLSALVRAGLLNEAIVDATNAVTLSPKDEHMHFLLAVSLHGLGRFTLAFEKCVALRGLMLRCCHDSVCR